MSTLYVDNLEPNLGSQVEIPDLKPLAGSVVQHVTTGMFYTTFSTTSSGWSKTANEINITPLYSNSRIVIHFQAVFLNQGGEGRIRIYRDDAVDLTSGMTNPLIHGDYDGNGQYNPYTLQMVDTPNTTSPVNYALYASVASSTFYVYRGQIVSAWEIAQ